MNDLIFVALSSFSITIETRKAMELHCVENALDFLSGKLRSEHRVI